MPSLNQVALLNSKYSRSTTLLEYPGDAAIDIFLTGEADVISINMLEEDIRIMRSSFGHPRYYRTFPRVLGKYMRKKMGLKRSSSEDIFRPS